MYLIFEGAAAICKCPGRLCSACGQVCQQIHCTQVKECCNNASAYCSKFVERPLSSFVVLTTILSIVELVFLAKSVSTEGLSDCTLPKAAFVDVSTWCYGQILFAAVNLLFAPYFQYKVWLKLYEKSDAEQELTRKKELQVERSVVQESFKDVFMTDFGVCFYVFGLIASFVWSSYGSSWVKDESVDATLCNPGGFVSLAANIGWAFFFVFLVFVLGWYCCPCCAKNTTIRDGYEPVGEEEAADSPSPSPP